MNISRRNFIKQTTAAGTLANSFFIRNARAAEKKLLKIALVGCGARGKGAASNCRSAAAQLGVELQMVAVADWFKAKAKLAGRHWDVPEKQCFGGATAYRNVMESTADLVILATPPNFRPVHFAAAVEAGKHAFIEKPVAVDPPGVRKVIASGKLAKQKGLSVIAGTQRRYKANYRRNAYLVHNGAIGDILNGQVYWCNQRGTNPNERKGKSDPDYLITNWGNWSMMSGDHIVEQHVHNIDVANWFIGRTPVTAYGFGGRARRKTGNNFDFFSVDFDYGKGCHVHSMCRQVNGCYRKVSEQFTGTKGTVSGNGKINAMEEIKIDTPSFMEGDGQVIEHYDLIKSIIEEKPLNEAETIANSTMTAIMGRISAYTGQIIRWADVMILEESKFYNLTLAPTALDFENGQVVAPQDDIIPIPGSA
ncbi:Gfo/Idh/MocA family protein [Verrucomicrobiota bacterium]